jgi:PhnB protein
MNIHPYLSFRGQCAEAFAFYEKVLGGKLEVMRYRDAPPNAGMPPPPNPDAVMHASLTGEGFTLFGADAPPQYQQAMQGFCVSLAVADAKEGAARFAALAEGGTVQMPFGPTFWTSGFGMCVDRFGTPWMVNAAH